jgi:general secretion pathway protein G
MAIASLVLGIAGFFTVGITAIPGLVLGIVAIGQIKRSGGRMQGAGLAIAGICISAAMMFLLLIVIASFVFWRATATHKMRVMPGIRAGGPDLASMRRGGDSRRAWMGTQSVRDGNAARAHALTDIATLGTALDLYTADNGSPPTTRQGLEALRRKPSVVPVPRNWGGPYIARELGTDPWGNSYVYRYPGWLNPDSYDLVSYGADGRPGGQGANADITNVD